MDLAERLEEFNEQFVEFCKIDDINLEERAKRVPAEKHFWATRLTEAEVEKYKLIKKKKDLFKKVAEKVHADSPTTITKNTLKDAVESSDEMKDINNELSEQEILLDHLNRIVKNISFVGQDIKNIISIKELNEL